MKHVVGAGAASFLVAVAILLLSWTTYFAQFNSAAYDFTLRLAGPIQPTSPIVIVAIDEDSLGRLGAWPWSREKLAQLVDRVERGGPRTIAVDILLDDKTSDEGDTALQAALVKAKSVVLAARIDPTGGSNHWRKPNPQFISNNTRMGHVHADPDFDGISRRIFSAKIADGIALSAFSIEALRGAGMAPIGDFEQDIGSATVLRPQPLNIRFVGDDESFSHIPAWQVLDGQIDSARFKDRIVLIGSTAEGLGDQWFTPFAEQGRRMSGVEIHANAIETLYAGRTITETPEAIVLLALAALIWALWWSDLRYEGRPFYIAALLAGPAVVVGAWMLLKFGNVWLPFPPFLGAIVVMLPALEVAKMVRVNRDLDRKIARLSEAAIYQGQRSGRNTPRIDSEVRHRIQSEARAGADRNGWLSALDAYEKESRGREQEKERLLDPGALQNSRWRLDAVDYFNDELVRFLSFNDAVLGSIEDVIIVSDPAGRIVYQNPAAKRLEGYSDDPPFAPDYFSLLLDRPNFMPDFAAVLSRNESLTLQSVASRTGKHFYNVALSPVSHVGVVLSMHDATPQHELNQAKSDMVSLVSHELRTPLTSIRGYSDMLLKYDLVSEKGKSFLGTIIDESSRLNQLIQSFLDIAYIESGRQQIVKTDFEVEPVIKDILSIVDPVASQKRIVIETPGNLSALRVRADRLLLYQALTNLVTNAIKYSPSDTRVRIAIANGGDRIRFQIADQGCGIPPEEALKVFEKFYRRGNKETRDQSGFGLGLSFVKEVAARHGGDIGLESEVGKGSVFTLWIPN